ncbi:alpha/beta fold hydrolase [Cryptosporangium phraense]|uniref:Alpha/beta hydrolase n=1 Tax=Cryptosporangium phraense TaxID=2593070 RepID=A0A545AM14_9ACTN|nr:alpha/beta fold hydrolase [Cryptosporangium phraense]TQS42359.1 alpha/beta hydrolase [Cryptosporangium phraense]
MATFGLIPGAGGQAWYWHRVVPLLEAAGHRAVAVDLPASDDSAGLNDYADAVVDALGGHDDLVLVAQSMGGLTAPLVAARIPVTRLILVNAMVPTPGETGGEWWTATGQDRAQRENDQRDGRDPDAPFDPLVYFLHDTPDDVTREAMKGAPEQSGTPFGEPWPLAAWPDIPTRVLVGRDDRLFPADFQVRTARERLGLDAELLDGGHLVALSRPEDLTALLLH